MTRALVLDGHVQSALAIVRSLGRRGIEVVVGAVDRDAMACRSRYAARRFVYPDPERDPEAFVDAVAAHSDGALVFTCSDATTLPVTRNRARLRGVVQAPSQDRVETAFDKRRTLKLAMELGIAVPPTAFLDDEAELDDALARLGQTVVVKPPHSCEWPAGGGPAVTGTAVFCAGAASARETVRRLHASTGELPLVQGVVRGAEVGFFGLFEDGEPLLTFGHRRLRSLRPSGGASALRESVEPHPDVRRWGLQLLGALRWTGVAMAEFKFDDATGVPHLMEINGRYWGSLPLAVAAGADFPWAAFRLAQVGRPDPSPPPRIGVRSRNFVGDLRHLAGVWKAGGPGRAAATRAFLTPNDADTTWDELAWDDPLPFFAQFVEKGRRVVRRRLR